MEDDSNIVEEVEQQEQKPVYDTIPDSLKSIFKKKTVVVNRNEQVHSVFNKTRGLDVSSNSLNIQEVNMKKAEEIYNKFNVFNKIPVNAKSIPPLNSIVLDKKER